MQAKAAREFARLAAATLLGLSIACVDPKVPPYILEAPSPTPSPTPTNPTPPAPAPIAPLTVNLSVGPTSPRKRAQATFEASTTGLQGPGSYAWDFGDGTTVATTATIVQHTYLEKGLVTASVRVTEESGRTATAAIQVTVRDEPQQPTPPPPPPPPAQSYEVTLSAAPSSLFVNDSATLTAKVALLNGAPAPTNYDWDCYDDGTVEARTTAPTNICVYPAPGSITSRVTVTGGTLTGSGTTTVTVERPALLVSVGTPLTGGPVPVGTLVKFRATVTTSGAMPAALNWEWDEGTGSGYSAIATGLPSPNDRTISCNATGVKTVRVRVTDPATGRQALGTGQITVQ